MVEEGQASLEAAKWARWGSARMYWDGRATAGMDPRNQVPLYLRWRAASGSDSTSLRESAAGLWFLDDLKMNIELLALLCREARAAASRCSLQKKRLRAI